jgi:GTP-binding protein
LGFDPVQTLSAAHGYGVKAFMGNLIQSFPKVDDEKETKHEIRVAVLGRPNVGKSSLINRILGMDRLVVSDLPGTTRDAVDTLFRFQSKDYRLIDTAGLRRKARVKEKIEKFSMIKAIKSLSRCHIAAILVDAHEGVSEQDARICGYAIEEARGILLIVNKWDLIKRDSRKREFLDNGIDRQLKFMSFAPRLNLSALTGEKVMKIFQKIDLIYDQFSRRISTGILNSMVQKIVEKHPPPRIGRGRLKFLYATQTYTKPPTFTLFVNRPDKVHFSYERFLINQIRETLNLKHTPVKLRFKKRS